MLLIHGNILTMEELNYPDGYLQIEGGVIKAIGPMSEVPADETVVDLDGKTVLPGFVDAHSHLGMWEDGLGFEGDDGNESTDPVTPQLRAIDALNPLDRTFEEAGRLAAYYSKSRGNDKVEIDYIEKKHVKKPGGGKPGFVIYHTNYSLVIDSDISGIEEVRTN